jgi:hypothetical protein
VSAESLELVATPARPPAAFVSSLALVLLVSGAALTGGDFPLAVYALSFWPYYVYALAFCIGVAPLGEIKRDAITVKTVSLVALGAAYLGAPVDGLSLAVVGGGFLLNALGARALGSDRTYYGHEVAGLPERHVTSFPYAWIAHPMLVGNMAAFGGTLVNPDFRRDWWPLAGAHVAMNLGLLLMELYVTPRLRERLRAVAAEASAAVLRTPVRTSFSVASTGAAVGGGLGWWAGFPTPSAADVASGAVIGAGILAHAAITFFCYSPPASRGYDGSGERHHELPR